ncbi:hypothetical protein PO909_024129 [Leuciscus waleckii]
MDGQADLSNVPGEYFDLKEVFSKSRAASLPPHRPYDCAINLLAGYIMSSEGVRMDPDKIKAVVDWPTPDSRKALQRCLDFIRNYSHLATPLTALTSTKTTFRWSSAAEAAFTKLKDCFVSTPTPVLVAPDPSRQFVVEVDASEVGAPRSFGGLGRLRSGGEELGSCPEHIGHSLIDDYNRQFESMDFCKETDGRIMAKLALNQRYL